MSFPRRGEIYLVSFGPTVGHEIKKTRPAIVIQNNISNEHSPVTIVAAISSHFGDPPHRREVLLAHDAKNRFDHSLSGRPESDPLH
jgi:mRNA interferase MazF